MTSMVEARPACCATTEGLTGTAAAEAADGGGADGDTGADSGTVVEETGVAAWLPAGELPAGGVSPTPCHTISATPTAAA